MKRVTMQRYVQSLDSGIKFWNEIQVLAVVDSDPRSAEIRVRFRFVLFPSAFVFARNSPYAHAFDRMWIICPRTSRRRSLTFSALTRTWSRENGSRLSPFPRVSMPFVRSCSVTNAILHKYCSASDPDSSNGCGQNFYQFSIGASVPEIVTAFVEVQKHVRRRHAPCVVLTPLCCSRSTSMFGITPRAF